MKELILETLRQIECKENVKIILAVESGSRAWGFASPDSDYDVRFIYVRPRDHYLRLDKTRDVIELPINDMLDVNGWDLSKTLQLLHSSNPTLFEWLASPIVYMQTEEADALRQLSKDYFSVKKSLHHYLHMAESNYREYLKGDMVRAKKYFYVLRPLLACQWILERPTPPPMLFSELAAAQLPREMTDTVNHLLDLKINAPEIRMIPKIDVLNEYLHRGIEQTRCALSALPEARDTEWDALNTFFRSHIL